jgi:CheY-like chemotaxis protein/phosphoribosyl 1,2-cyclic phosphodiesterase
MKLRFWGARGSIPTPGRSTLRFGGNTACVELRTDDGQLFILDCGTGLRELGNRLLKSNKPIHANILLSHTHWDHTQGFAFFKPLARKETSLTIFSSSGVDRKLSDILSRQMDYLNFPVALEEQRATLEFRDIGEESFTVGDVRIRSQFVNHTVLTLGFRISVGGVRVVYIPDHEPFSPVLYRSGIEHPSLTDVVHAGDRKHIDFLRDADLVIHDAQYTEAEYERTRNWGHSTWNYAVDVCVAAGVKRLALFHHDPDHDDAFVEQIEADAQERARAQGSPLMVVAAEEGMSINLTEDIADGTTTITGPIASVTRPKQPRILVVDDEPGMVHFVKTVLSKDGYDILTAYDGVEALEVARREHPDLVLLDVMMPRMDGYAVLEELRATPGLSEIPVIMFTAKIGEADIVRSFEGGVTDYISKPAAPAVLRSRVSRGLLSRE